MILRMPDANEYVEAELTSGRYLGALDIAETPAIDDVAAAALDAIEHPVGLDTNLWEIVRPGETVVVVVSDSFRKTGIDQVLPCLLEGLLRAGIRERDISFVFSTGTHRAPTPEEQRAILGFEVYDRFKDRAFPHDASDEANLVHVGLTSRGTPVYINRRAVEADRLIATGTVVLHYFGGFGGGRKSILPGISGVTTISHNHAMNLDPIDDRLNPNVRIGALDGNPVAEDMLEGSRLVKVDYIINTVLNREGRISRIVAGEMDAAHRAACEYAYGLYTIPIQGKADLVVAASPSTRNYVQTHKALYNAYQAVKPEGRIVLLAPCPEGLGGEQFAKWVRLGDRSRVIAELRKRSEINGQTALSTLEKSPITLFVTDMDASKVKLLGGRKAASFATALDTALAELEARGIHEPTVYAMPSAAYTVPIIDPTTVAIDS